MSKCHVHFNGRMGKDPEVREVGENKVATLSLAVSEKWKGKDGNMKEHTTWLRAECWNAQATLAQKYIHKGDMVGIHGTLRGEKYTDKEGQERIIMKIRINEFDLLPNKGERKSNSDAPASGGKDPQGTEIDNDIPF